MSIDLDQRRRRRADDPSTRPTIAANANADVPELADPTRDAEQVVVVVVVVVGGGAAAGSSAAGSATGASTFGAGKQIESSPFGVHFSSTSQAESSVHGVRQTFDTHVFEEQSTFSTQASPAIKPGGVPSSRT